MEKTVYLDLLFLINFSMDFLCFYISARIISVRFSALRATLAAVIGGVYGVLALFFVPSAPVSFLFDALICFFMCLIVFSKKIGIFFSTIVYFSVSMALGGFMTAIFNLMNRMGFSSLVVEGDGISVWIFASLALLSGIFTLIGGKSFRRRSSARRAEVSVIYNKRERVFSALVDSGNLLCEPISGRPRIAVDIDAVRGFLPEELIRIAACEKVDVAFAAGSRFAKSIRIVPAHTATGERILLGFRAEKIFIDAGKGRYDSDAFIVLSHLEAPLGVAALVPSQLLN